MLNPLQDYTHRYIQWYVGNCETIKFYDMKTQQSKRKRKIKKQKKFIKQEKFMSSNVDITAERHERR